MVLLLQPEFVLFLLLVVQVQNDEIQIKCEDEEMESDDKNKICYKLIETEKCPYPEILPFNDYKTIIDEDIKVPVEINNIYGYNMWNEKSDSYGELIAVQNLTTNNTQTTQECIVADMTNKDNVSYYKTDRCEKIAQVCAYNNTLDNSKSTFCERYDLICQNDTNINKTGCYCSRNNPEHFCELTCTEKCNDSECLNCDQLYEDYTKNPQIQLSFNRNSKSITLTIVDYKSLMELNTNNQTSTIVYCFTNAYHKNNTLRYKYTPEEFDFFSKDFHKLRFTFKAHLNGTGRYSCLGFTNEEKLVQSGEILAEGSGINCTKAFTLNITVPVSVSSVFDIHENTSIVVKDLIQAENIAICHLNFLKLYPKINQTMKLAYRVYVNESDNYEDIFSKIQKAHSNVNLSTSYCLNETTKMGDFKLNWPITAVGRTVMPNELCLGTNRSAVTRTCLGDYLYGVYWSEVKGFCQEFTKDTPKNKTIDIYLLKNNTTVSEKLTSLKDCFDSVEDVIDADLYYTTEIINQIKKESNYNLTDFIEMISKLMDIEKYRMDSSQSLLNVTDNLLYSLDQAVEIFSKSLLEPCVNINTKNIHVQVSSLNSSNIIGTAVYKINGDLSLVPISKGIEKFGVKEMENLKMTAYLGNKDLKDNNNSLVIIIFRSNNLFHQEKSYKNTGFTTSIFVTGGYNIKDVLRIYTKPDRKYRASLTCSHWSYGLSPIWYNSRGAWSQNYLAIENGDLQLCMYYHLTHLGILIGKEESVALNIITAIGCVISTIGALGIITTAMLMKTWREQTGTKLLLNVATVLILRNCFLFVSSAVDSYTEETLCIIVGVLLHYSVISQFSWMLIVGYLQYRRFVLVLVDEKKYLILKLCMYAWGTPIIPIAAKLFDSKSDYINKEYCYLKDEPLYYFVFIPVALVIAINLTVFGLIIYAFQKNKTRAHRKGSIIMLQVKLGILLFFVLGFSWVFGILAGFLRLEVFSYLFSILATLEGCVMFVYYVLFNKTTRKMWLKLLKRAQSIQTMSDWLSEKKKLGPIKLSNSSRKVSSDQ